MLTTGDFGSLAARSTGAHWRLMTPPQHLWFFNRDSIASLAHSVGLRVESSDHPWKFVVLADRLPGRSHARPQDRGQPDRQPVRHSGEPVRRDMITPPVRVAMARPVARPVARVRRQLGTPCRTIMTIEKVDQLMANRNGTSIGAKNRLPYT